MRAWRVHQLGDPADALVLDDVEPPGPPGPGEVVIAVRAAALNFPDVLLCRGEYQIKPPIPFGLGSEVSGTVVAVGEGVDHVREGQRVMALPSFGTAGLADRARCGAGGVHPVPDSMSDTAAAAFHVVYQTAYLALHHRGGLRAGETLLVHAGAGGVGSAAIQLGRAAGARVIATAGGAAKVAACERLGADLVVDYTERDFVDPVKEATGGRGADVVFDPVGGDVFDRSRRCVASEGRILVIGFAGGRIADLPTNHALVKNYSVVGVNIGLYAMTGSDVIGRHHAELMALHAAGAIEPFVGETPPFEAVPDALTRMAARRTMGKVVCLVDPAATGVVA